ncbi:MAG: SHOCT domain-containing protein [Chloroflexi bacterium]|nr:MAG: SHOCT domain-containing protein [Chloroflexota bacterium]
MWCMPGMGWWMVISGILVIIFLVGLIVLIVWGIKQVSGHNSAEAKKALGIAQERYARGEITKEEFEQLKKDLK